MRGSPLPCRQALPVVFNAYPVAEHSAITKISVCGFSVKVKSREVGVVGQIESERVVASVTCSAVVELGGSSRLRVLAAVEARAAKSEEGCG